MELYNSLTRKREALPLAPAHINMYACGVTVYDKCHIGHARSLYTFDTLVRYMRYRGYQVRFVRNITDVDDKIIHKAKQTGRSFEDVVNENIALYHKDVVDLGLNLADSEPRATENIPLMVAHIEGLMAKGHAYVSAGDVYFRVRSFPTYGQLSGQSPDRMLEAVRIDKDSHKEDPLDFALWKEAKPGEPFWPSPWSAGRPGWHIECSCMSMKHLGTATLDIHAGGRDLLFPHHENEIAQSEALTGQPFARMWVHHGLLTIDAQKMSKSLGNFITVQEALGKFSVSALKLFFLSTHYASSIDFTEDKLGDMEKSLVRLKSFISRARQIPAAGGEIQNDSSDFARPFREKVWEALDRDFNTALAVGFLFDFLSAANRLLDVGPQDENFSAHVRAALCFFKEIAEGVLGLSLEETGPTLSKEEMLLLDERVLARQSRNWQRSDEIRDILKGKGIIVEDGKAGQSWKQELKARAA